MTDREWLIDRAKDWRALAEHFRKKSIGLHLIARDEIRSRAAERDACAREIEEYIASQT